VFAALLCNPVILLSVLLLQDCSVRDMCMDTEPLPLLLRVLLLQLRVRTSSTACAPWATP
jgi:hypothetical protein